MQVAEQEKKNPFQQALGRKRWEDIPKKVRSAHMSALRRGYWASLTQEQRFAAMQRISGARWGRYSMIRHIKRLLLTVPEGLTTGELMQRLQRMKQAPKSQAAHPENTVFQALYRAGIKRDREGRWRLNQAQRRAAVAEQKREDQQSGSG